MSDEFGIANAIESLREALTAAIEEGDKQRARMRFRMEEPVVIELQTVLTKDAHGKLGWKVVELGGSYTSANTHKVTLQLKPEWWDEAKKEYNTKFQISAELPPAPGAPADGQQEGPGPGDGHADHPFAKGLEDN